MPTTKRAPNDYISYGKWKWDINKDQYINQQNGFTITRSAVDMLTRGISRQPSEAMLLAILDKIEADQKKRDAHPMKEVKKFRSTIAIDFDGVIHSYEDGWKDGTIYGTLVPGTKEALTALMEQFNVYILTSRDPVQVKDWMQKHLDFPIVLISDQELFWNTPGVIGVTNKKYAAIAYIDDRAVVFTGWNGLTIGKDAKK